jgi:hypothetical protein
MTPGAFYVNGALLCFFNAASMYAYDKGMYPRAHKTGATFSIILKPRYIDNRKLYLTSSSSGGNGGFKRIWHLAQRQP